MIESLDAEILAILQLLITNIYIDILYIKCPGHVLDITKFMSMDGTVLDVPSMDIVPSHYQHCYKVVILYHALLSSPFITIIPPPSSLPFSPSFRIILTNFFTIF